jgi:hypothetical protein
MFGMSASLSADGNTLAVGARNHDGGGLDRGQVKVFSWGDTDWAQRGNAVVGPDDYAFLGWSVCLSADGDSYVVGLPAYTHHEISHGRVRVYEWDGASWLQKGAEIQGLAEDDRCGYAVEMNSDGSKILLGAPFHDGELAGAGQLRIFSYGFVGISDQDFGSAFSISPNPASEQIHIALGEIHQEVSVTLRNINGQLISSKSYQNVSEIIYETDTPAGIYFIEIQDGNNHSALLKVVKQ